MRKSGMQAKVSRNPRIQFVPAGALGVAAIAMMILGALTAPTVHAEFGGKSIAAKRIELVGSTIPQTVFPTVDGVELDSSQMTGQHTLLIFSNPNAKAKGIEWFRSYAKDFVSIQNLSIVNVVSPQGASLVAPKSTLVRRLKRSVDKVMVEVRESLPPNLKPRLDALDVHWTMDWKGRISESFIASVNELSMVLVGPDGFVKRYDDQVGDEIIKEVVRSIEGARTEKEQQLRQSRMSSLISRLKGNDAEYSSKSAVQASGAIPATAHARTSPIATDLQSPSNNVPGALD